MQGLYSTNQKKEKKMTMIDSHHFNNRVYGIQIIKSKNSNYNADFTGCPRTLPNGRVYSTDKVDKFNIRKYLGRNDSDNIFIKTTYTADLKPMILKEVYEYHFGEIGNNKSIVLKNLLSKIDVRLFGATFAPKGVDHMNISIHGPVQINYGINKFEELKDSGIYTDQIGSPYASKQGADQTTLGSQTRSQEAHYVHHFSINPKNLYENIDQFFKAICKDAKNSEKISKKNKSKSLDKTKVKKFIDLLKLLSEEKDDLSDLIVRTQKLEPEDVNQFKKLIEEAEKKIKQPFFESFQILSITDIQLLKQAMAVGTTYYDSTSKKDSENELLFWIELKEGSEKILRNFTDLIEISSQENGRTQIDFSKVKKYLRHFQNDVSKIEVYYDQDFTDVINLPDNCKVYKELNSVFEVEI